MSEAVFMDAAEMMRRGEEHDRKMDAVFEFDREVGVLTLKMAYPYHIELSRIPDKAALLGWVVHLCEKDWMKTEHVYEFITRVCRLKGWQAYANL